jgi:FkbM family methyltransferase
MQNRVKTALRRALARSGWTLTRSDHFAALERTAYLASKLDLVAAIMGSETNPRFAALAQSPSQLGQDIFALEQSGWKRGGFFVEFGATDGKTMSNSWLLERHFGWTGILAEPARCWHAALAASGRSAAIETDCVWSSSGQTFEFHEADWAETSTIAALADGDHHNRAIRRSYPVKTVSLNDMLARHGAPAEMDFLSIDTEGSELEILRSLDFDRYRFRTLVCEHNFGPDREAIHALLSGLGYVRKFAEITLYDDWYVRAD